MDIHDLIPQDKHDFETVRKLQHYNKEELSPIIPDLLMWLQDMNWPIADEIKKLLLIFNEDLVPHVRSILLTDDGEWKFWIVTCLLKEVMPEVLLLLKPDLERIRDYPTEDETYSEVNVEVNELLNRLIRNQLKGRTHLTHEHYRDRRSYY